MWTKPTRAASRPCLAEGSRPVPAEHPAAARSVGVTLARAVARARPATEADVPTVLHLFDELFAAATRTGGRSPDEVPGTSGRRAEAEQRYRASFADPDSRLLVAVVDDPVPATSRMTPEAEAAPLMSPDVMRDELEPILAERIVGMVLCSVGGSGTFLDAPVVQMNHFFV